MLSRSFYYEEEWILNNGCFWVFYLLTQRFPCQPTDVVTSALNVCICEHTNAKQKIKKYLRPTTLIQVTVQKRKNHLWINEVAHQQTTRTEGTSDICQKWTSRRTKFTLNYCRHSDVLYRELTGLNVARSWGQHIDVQFAWCDRLCLRGERWQQKVPWPPGGV